MVDLPDIIRVPNHLGDLVMALPALEAAPGATLLVTRWLLPLAELLERDAPVIPLDRGVQGMMAAARAVRAAGCRRGVLLPPSLSSALMLRLGGVRHLRGTTTDGRGLLLTDGILPQRHRDRHRTVVYRELVTGNPEDARMLRPRLPVPAGAAAEWGALAGGAGGPGRAVAGVFPGSNARSRRWDADRFAAVARGLAADGVSVLVFGGPAERELTRRVAGEWALDLGGRTRLAVLAAALAGCHILITNDSGPMHLAAAVGTRTLVVSGPADTRETAPAGDGHVYLQRTDLPCVPCVRNECPRKGGGYILAEAERECLRLIEVAEVLTAARRMLAVAP
jgi:heptosyltransferase II